jgi:hypothetical protein
LAFILTFRLAFILLVGSLVEFFGRSNSLQSIFYFYKDSEWRRNHSLFR